MNKNDFIQVLWALPFLGGFLAFIISSLFRTGEAALGVMIMLGILTGSITLLTYILGIHFVVNKEKSDISDKTE